MSSTFESLKFHNYRLWFCTALVANTGTWILDLAGGRARVSASASRGVPVSLPRLAQLVAGIAPVFGDAVPADLVRASVLRPWAGLFEF